MQKNTINPPPADLFLEDLVRFEMGVQEAEARKIEDDPIVKERIRQEIYKALIEKEIGDQIKNIKVNEPEMQAFYKNNPEIRTSHILIEFKPGATPEEKAVAKKRAEEIYSEVKASKRPFEDLVKLYSDDSLSKRAGGDVGWQSRLTLVPTYYDSAIKMKIGEVKGLIETQYGYHIIKLTGINSYKKANKRQIRASVFDEKRKDLFNKYFVQLKKKYRIKTYPEQIK